MRQPIVAQAVPRARLDVRVRNRRGTLLVAVGTDALELTETAASIWRLIDGTRSISEIGAVMASEYDIDLQTATSDATEIITVLADHGVVIV